MADGLSRHTILLTTVKIVVQGFDHFKDQFVNDADFAEIWSICINNAPAGSFHIK